MGLHGLKGKGEGISGQAAGLGGREPGSVSSSWCAAAREPDVSHRGYACAGEQTVMAMKASLALVRGYMNAPLYTVSTRPVTARPMSLARWRMALA